MAIAPGSNQIDSPKSSPMLKVISDIQNPLLGYSIQIRGVNFTLAELEVLYKELHRGGFAKPAGQAATSLLQASYELRGVRFTDADLRELVNQTKVLAAQFQKVVTL